MTPRFTRSLLYSLAALAFAGCNGAVPKVSGHRLVIPDRSPSRAVQALDAPSTSDASGSGDGSHAQAYCKDGEAGSQTNDPDGNFDNIWLCAPGGGVQQIENVGFSDPQTGDGHYDQITTYDDGTQQVWHFTFDTSDDFLVQTYTGQSDDGSETYNGVYTYNAADFSHAQMHEVWNLHEGSYVTDGVVASDGTSFVGTETFDDPSTSVSPDWTDDQTTNPDGSFSQTVHFNGAGFVSDYTYALAVDGSSDYQFATDLDDTEVNPDYDGAYTYAADGSGQGSYTQHFDDGSTDVVTDDVRADGSLVESWSFDDVSTEQSVDQEGQMTWSADGSGEGSVTTHVVGGGDQTCDVHVTSDGAQTVDNCR